MARRAYPHHGRLDSSCLPTSIKGEDPTSIPEGKGSDLAIVEAMKKYKMENKKRGSAISSIKDKAIRMETQILIGKVMCKYRTDEVPASVVALAEQCMEGVQFN